MAKNEILPLAALLAYTRQDKLQSPQIDLKGLMMPVPGQGALNQIMLDNSRQTRKDEQGQKVGDAFSDMAGSPGLMIDGQQQPATGLFSGLNQQQIPQMQMAVDLASSPLPALQEQGFDMLDAVQGNVAKQNIASIKDTDKTGIEFLKEERKTASQDIRSFNTQAKAMRTSYGQLKGLANQAKGGDRGAKNAMVVTLARLISPGIVTETEASALSGGQNTMQYVVQSLVGKGDADIQNLLKSIDPYGENFNSDELLKVGESVVASSRKPLIDMYEGSRDRASRSGMSERAFNTNFGTNKNYDFLTQFKSSNMLQSRQQDGDTATNHATGERIVYRNGKWQPAP